MNKLPTLPLDLDNSPARMSIQIKAGELATQMRRWGYAVYAAGQQAAPEAASLSDAINRIADDLVDEAQPYDGEFADVVRSSAEALRELTEGGTAPQAASQQGVAENAEQIQWRNIRKVVREVAKFCFGGADDKVYGTFYTAVVTCLTAKDGVHVELESLRAPQAATTASMSAVEGYGYADEDCDAPMANGACSECGFGPCRRAQAPLSNAEFLAKRIGRVAKLAGVMMPDGTYEQIAEVAGTILGEIARALETRATQIKQWQQRAWENGCDTELQPDPKHYTNEMQAEIRDLRAALAPSKGDNLDR